LKLMSIKKQNSSGSQQVENGCTLGTARKEGLIMQDNLQIFEFMKKTVEHKGPKFGDMVQAIANIQTALGLVQQAQGEALAKRLGLSIMMPLVSLASSLDIEEFDLLKHVDMLHKLAREDIDELRKG
jgi:hypothetical protein